MVRDQRLLLSLIAAVAAAARRLPHHLHSIPTAQVLRILLRLLLLLHQRRRLVLLLPPLVLPLLVLGLLGLLGPPLVTHWRKRRLSLLKLSRFGRQPLLVVVARRPRLLLSLLCTLGWQLLLPPLLLGAAAPVHACWRLFEGIFVAATVAIYQHRGKRDRLACCVALGCWLQSCRQRRRHSSSCPRACCLACPAAATRKAIAPLAACDRCEGFRRQ